MTTTPSEHELGAALLSLARNAIGQHLGGAPHKTLQVGELTSLEMPAATFVTLTKSGELRGCIGTLEAHRTLRQDVEENARAAALRDPRFPPVTVDEWPALKVEVSRLTPPETMQVQDEADLRRQLRPHVDGVIFQAGERRATFLPQVWEQLPTPESFLAQLKQKAGLPTDFWSPEVKIQRYQVQKWKEP